MQIDDILAAFALAEVPLSDNQARLFLRYHDLILKWNPKANLISKGDEARILERHFLESALVSGAEEFGKPASVLDVGSGGGFPGVPIKILHPELHLVLLESKRWKGLFLNTLVKELNLADTVVVCDRAEAVAQDPDLANSMDVVVCRAVAALSDLVDLSAPFLKSTGVLLAVKGSAVRNEIDKLRKITDVDLSVGPLPGPRLELTKHLRIVRVKSI